MNNSLNITLGILAHVDAGKTTLSEALLYKTGAIRSPGRVDAGNTHLDTDELEKQRGITIYSRQAVFSYHEKDFCLIDTPGHADFSPEMERALSVLDYAVLLISAPDSVTGQTKTLFSLLKLYQVPVFFFVNKMDQAAGEDRETLRIKVLEELKSVFGASVVDFSSGFGDETVKEELAVCDELLLGKFLEGGELTEEEVRNLIKERKTFPVWFGSALKLEGIDEFLEGLNQWVLPKNYPGEFGARVYKITHEQDGKRLCWMKITGGTIHIKDTVAGTEGQDGKAEKVERIRSYTGEKYTFINEARAGSVVAVEGLSSVHAGQGLGIEPPLKGSVTGSVMKSELLLPREVDAHLAFIKLRELNEEDPALGLSYDEESKLITVGIMGQVQKEVLGERIADRFGWRVRFGAPRIVYMETIAESVEGVGHFEPLRHYAEVHLLLEPLPAGSGLMFAADCPPDTLAGNWQRLILTHLMEKRHRGVLTGSEITDMKITLIGGKAHLKHTEGGDFRQATYRAVRQGLMMAKSVLLEPVLSFRMELPRDGIGRAMNDLEQMGAKFAPPEINDEKAVIEGTVPASSFGEYSQELLKFTRGDGRVSTAFYAYLPAHDPEEVIAASGYDPELDLKNPSSSVFCSHGAGTLIPWYEVRDYMHVDTGFGGGETPEEIREAKIVRSSGGGISASEAELMAIFERTYGQVKDPLERSREAEKQTVRYDAPREKKYRGKARPEKEYLLVDGYNIIFSWRELKELSEKDIKAARDRLADILSAFAGAAGMNVILVFDAYKVSGGSERVEKYHNIHIVYTREAETADQYIEKTAHELKKDYGVCVATSDAVEQVIIYGAGALRLSADDLFRAVSDEEKRIREIYLENQTSEKTYLKDVMPEILPEDN
ncbi:MAG: TetM/TetW/TetO/TetS family tetracycline resistance ribosomal protection protein [Lachnospiraceae bacterium]|nr:TetM/TetW/TetO/TetS family tetracycline resistance ribosomal protection protein [Lachnospiraceae bacterium]